MIKSDPFKYFHSSPKIIHLAVMLYVRFPLSLRNVEDLLHERGVEISHETVRIWWNRFGPMFASEILRNRVSRMRAYSNWQRHLDEDAVDLRIFVRCLHLLEHVGGLGSHDGRVRGGTAGPIAHAQVLQQR